MVRIAPDALGVAGEPLQPAAAATIEASFDAPLIDYYASSESGTMARTHPGVPGLYLVEESLVLERPTDKLAETERAIADWMSRQQGAAS